MNHTQVTIKLWRDSREILRQISRMTREPQVLVLHRLLMVEQRRLEAGSGGDDIIPATRAYKDADWRRAYDGDWGEHDAEKVVPEPALIAPEVSVLFPVEEGEA